MKIMNRTKVMTFQVIAAILGIFGGFTLLISIVWAVSVHPLMRITGLAAVISICVGKKLADQWFDGI